MREGNYLTELSFSRFDFKLKPFTRLLLSNMQYCKVLQNVGSVYFDKWYISASKSRYMCRPTIVAPSGVTSNS